MQLHFLLIFSSLWYLLLGKFDYVNSITLTPEEKKFIQLYRRRGKPYTYPTTPFAPAGHHHHHHHQLQLQQQKQYLEWVISENLTKWYNDFDLCMLNYSSSNVTIEEMTNNCTTTRSTHNSKNQSTLLPVRCRAGNAWPLKSGYCSPLDVAFSERINFRKAIKGYDDPSQKPLYELFSKLASENGALLLIGDSVMQQFFGALGCELEREGIWNDPKSFKNTDEIRFVNPNLLERGGHSSGEKLEDRSVPIKFVPIYHFVDGRYDKCKDASMNALNDSTRAFLKEYNSLLIVFNVGLHYVGSTIKDFTRSDFQKHITEAFRFLQNLVLLHLNVKKIRILWRESTAQHFPTSNGYWPGMRYASGMKLECVEIADKSPDGNWRNTDVEMILERYKFDQVKIIRFYNLTVPMYTEHVNGNLRDCTHLCWTPMLYQSIFHAMVDAMNNT